MEFPDLEVVGPWGSNNVANQRMGDIAAGDYSATKGEACQVSSVCRREIGLVESQRGVDR